MSESKPIISDNYEHRASVRARLAGDSEWIGEYFGKVAAMFQQQDNLTLNVLPGRPQDVLHPDGKGDVIQGRMNKVSKDKS